MIRVGDVYKSGNLWFPSGRLFTVVSRDNSGNYCLKYRHNGEQHRTYATIGFIRDYFTLKKAAPEPVYPEDGDWE